MKSGDKVIWERLEYTVLAEYDNEYVYLDTGPNNAQLVPVSELVLA